MHHQIKINRAQRIASKLPMANKEIGESIPEALIRELTSRQLAAVVNALDRHWHKAVNHAHQEVVAEGYVWSNKHQALLDVVYPKEV